MRACNLPPGAMVFADAPPRRVAGYSRRPSYRAARRRKLSPEQEAAVRAQAGKRTLRELADEFGVSHETVRSIVRTSPPVSPTGD